MMTIVTGPSFSLLTGMGVLLFLDSNTPATFFLVDTDDDVSLGLSRTRNVTPAFGIVDQQFENVAPLKLFEPHFRFRPVERAFHTVKIDLLDFPTHCGHT